MLTFNVQSKNGKWYSGYEPSEGGPWNSKQDEALVLTAKQAQELKATWFGRGLRIEFSARLKPIDDYQFKQELFCIAGGRWHDFDFTVVSVREVEHERGQ